MLRSPKLDLDTLLFIDAAYVLTIDQRPVAIRVRMGRGYYDFALTTLFRVGLPPSFISLQPFPEVPLYLKKGSTDEYLSKRELNWGRLALDCSEDLLLACFMNCFIQAYYYRVENETVHNYSIPSSTLEELQSEIFPYHRKKVCGCNGRLVRYGVTFCDPEARDLKIFVRSLHTKRLFLFTLPVLRRFLTSSQEERSFELYHVVHT